jgi:hypothetical protein
MVPECKLFESIPLQIQELNYKKIVYELKDHVRKETLNLNLSSKLGPIKKFFLQVFPTIC